MKRFIKYTLSNPLYLCAFITLALSASIVLISPLLPLPDFGISMGSYLPPGTQGFPLGSDGLGRNQAAGLYIGFCNSFIICLAAACISVSLGTFMGLLAGYFGDTGLKPDPNTLVRWCIWPILVAYFGWLAAHGHILAFASGENLWMGAGLLVGTVVLLWYLIFRTPKNRKSKPHYNFPLDSLIVRLMEMFVSVPKILLLLCIAAVIRPSAVSMVILIGVLNWVSAARLVRAETMKTKEQDFVENLVALGYTPWQIVSRHIFPNISHVIITALALDFSAIILMEASLSFLNIGLPADVPTLGRLISESRGNLHAWWLVLFPGLAIFALVYASNLLGEALNRHLNVKNQT